MYLVPYLTPHLVGSILLASAIITATIRYFLIINNIKKYSKLLLHLQTLNDKYSKIFFDIPEEMELSYECKNLQAFKNNDDARSIFNYMCKRVDENELWWREMCKNTKRNKSQFAVYASELSKIAKRYGGTSYNEVRRHILFFTKDRYIKSERQIFRSKMLEPETKLNIAVDLRYTSPAGRNHYSRTWLLDEDDIDYAFVTLRQNKNSRRYSDTKIRRKKPLSYGDKIIRSANERGGYLYREPLPTCMHWVAPRKSVKESTWKKISNAVRAETNFCCCMCGEDCSEKKGTLHTHELYEFDTEKNLARVIDLIPICVRCHNVIHCQGAMLRGVDPQDIDDQQEIANKGKEAQFSENRVFGRLQSVSGIGYIDCTYFRKYIPTLPDKIIRKGEKYES
jgi:hypothetical protein